MPRGLNAEAIQLLEDGANLKALLYLGFSTAVEITDAHFPIDWDGRTYTPSNTLLDLADVNETTDIRVNTWTFTVSGTDQFWYSLVLSGSYTDVPVEYRLAILRPNQTAADVIVPFVGTISGADFDENDRRSRIKIQCAGHWADFQRRAGRLTNPASHELYAPGDGAFFEFAAEPIRDLRWTLKENN